MTELSCCRYKQAQVAYAKAVEKNAAKENVARSSSYMRDLNNLANSYSLDGAWDVAKEKFREALQLFRAMPADVLADRQEKIFLSQLLTNLAAACNETVWRAARIPGVYAVTLSMCQYGRVRRMCS